MIIEKHVDNYSIKSTYFRHISKSSLNHNDTNLIVFLKVIKSLA